MTETLDIKPYEPDWVERFEEERARLQAALADLAVRIEHHGSTSVPGLAAKPVIDIQISVRRLQPLDRYARRLLELGYVHVPHPDDAFAPFFHRPATWPHTHHVHVVVAGGEEERKTLAFRDFLRDHDDVAREYEALKRQLAPHYSSAQFDTRQAYADAKGSFIAKITSRALLDGYPRDSQPEPGLEQQLRELEEGHLRPEVRSSPESMGALLADGFVEFGSSGRVFDRTAVIASASEAAPFRSRIEDFVVRALAPGIALTTYRLSAWPDSESQAKVTLRSSVWVHRAGRWVLLFHQGTLARR